MVRQPPNLEVVLVKKALIPLLLLSLLALLVTGCSRPVAPKDTEVASAALNGTYKLGNDTFTLLNGKAEKEAAPGSATKVKITVFGQPVLGDFNGDGWKEAALLLTSQPGGSGTFFYVAVIGKNKSSQKFVATNAILLGDRIAPQNVELHGSNIVVNYADRKPGEPMSTQPSVGVTKTFRISGDTLVEVK